MQRQENPSNSSLLSFPSSLRELALKIEDCRRTIPGMVNGAHLLIYSKNANKTRAFFRDVLKFPSVDAGRGWLIFALPPAELGVHPAESKTDEGHELYLMCEDVKKTVATLKRKKVKCGPIREAGFGTMTSIKIPGGGSIGLYQPKHPTAIGKK